MWFILSVIIVLYTRESHYGSAQHLEEHRWLWTSLTDKVTVPKPIDPLTRLCRNRSLLCAQGCVNLQFVGLIRWVTYQNTLTDTNSSLHTHTHPTVILSMTLNRSTTTLCRLGKGHVKFRLWRRGSGCMSVLGHVGVRVLSINVLFRGLDHFRVYD